MKGDGRIGEVFVTGLESWKPEEMYDLVWIQWCIGHLTDSQTVEFLGRCKENLQEMGWIVIKENLSSLSEDMFDELDSSVTRTDGKFKSLFASAELRVVREEVQKGFPPELLRVKIYALVRV